MLYTLTYKIRYIYYDKYQQIASPEAAGFAVGQKIDVKFLGKNDKGQMRLSRRAVMLRDSNPNPAGRSTGIETLNNAPNPISAAAEALFAENSAPRAPAADASK
jgi:hypothetical protein